MLSPPKGKANKYRRLIRGFCERMIQPLPRSFHPILGNKALFFEQKGVRFHRSEKLKKQYFPFHHGWSFPPFGTRGIPSLITVLEQRILLEARTDASSQHLRTQLQKQLV